MSSIVISAGHGLYVRGASSDMLDEVDEARRVVSRVTALLRDAGVQVKSYWDDISTTQSENLQRIVDFHNSCTRDGDVSIHFNAYEQTDAPRGCEVLYRTAKTFAAEMSEAIAEAGDLIDRGAKYDDGELYFLSHTEKPAVLLEICFVDSTSDVECYQTNFDLICEAIADMLGAEDAIPPEPEPDVDALFHAKGKCSYFGGPDDMGVDADEGLAFHTDITPENQFLFLPIDEGTGLARRLNPAVHYLAARWDYSVTPKDMLANSGQVALVKALKTGRALTAVPSDWGPHEDTNRVADLSPSLLNDLGLETDDEVEVIYPWGT